MDAGVDAAVDDDCPADLTTPDGYIQALVCPEYKSCAFQCGEDVTCTEPQVPYACPAMAPWTKMAHAASCGSYDGTTTPAPVPGVCTATAPTADALLPAGEDPLITGRVRLPDGHYVQAGGNEQILAPSGVLSGFPLNVMLVPGTRFAVVSDSGVVDNAIEVVDLVALAENTPSLVSSIPFPSPTQLYYGLAYVAPNHVYASGGGDGVVYAFTLDMDSGKLARDTASDLSMGPAAGGTGNWYVGGIAVTSDAKSLVVAPSTGETALRVVNLATKAETSIDLGGPTELFDVIADPTDPTGATFWVSALDARALIHVDVVQGKVLGTIPVGKNPEGVLVLDAQRILSAASDDDTLFAVDSMTGATLTKVSVKPGALDGVQPGVLAVDAANNRVYATLSGINAIGAYSLDTLEPLGEIPTGWWPTAVRVQVDGSLVIVTGKGHGTGADPEQVGPGPDGNDIDLTRGSIQVVPFPTTADLSTMTTTVSASRQATPAEGYPTVTCPSGAPYDFPIPLTNTGAPSADIQHVVFVLRENKTFDALFGDLPGVNGDPALLMSPGRMDELWHNARDIARTFTVFDGFYVDAEQSLQGHVWATMGRSTDYIERTWTSAWGRTRTVKAGLDSTIGYPAEGSMFTWLEANDVPYDDMGEIVGAGSQGFDTRYPGLVYTVSLPDVNKSCYVAARARATCDLTALTFIVLPNDHTVGMAAQSPAPEVMVAVNDEATGMILDAVSHSPIWPTTLVIVAEDDPQNGGDHVDAHRTAAFMASPWVKRGYVTKTHIDAASMHKLLAHVLAKPYPSQIVADAAIPYDAFTSTPDYTPYTYAPRTTATVCNPIGTVMARVAAGWDLSMPDNQPGLNEQVEARLKAVARSVSPAPAFE